MKNGLFQANVINNLTIVGESTDKRVRRIESARVFSNGVASYRARIAADDVAAGGREMSADVGEDRGDGKLSSVFVRARPLFDHEAERGEWDCVTGRVNKRGIIVHEGCERVKPNQGRVKVLRHHAFNQVHHIGSDEGVYAELQYLVQEAVAGRKSTL